MYHMSTENQVLVASISKNVVSIVMRNVVIGDESQWVKYMWANNVLKQRWNSSSLAYKFLESFFSFKAQSFVDC